MPTLVCPEEKCHCAAGGASTVVLEVATVEGDPEKGPLNDSLESSDSSKVSLKQGRSGPYMAGGFP